MTATGIPPDSDRSLQDEVVALATTLPGLRRLTVRSGERAIEVEWEPGACSRDDARRVRSQEAAVPPPRAKAEAEADEVPDGLLAVLAPLVGTFYAASAPDAEPFVRVGDEVEAGQTLGLVEAMKLMNPIVAEEPGVVTEIRVENAGSVEYDQVLMLLRRLP